MRFNQQQTSVINPLLDDGMSPNIPRSYQCLMLSKLDLSENRLLAPDPVFFWTGQTIVKAWMSDDVVQIFIYTWV